MQHQHSARMISADLERDRLTHREARLRLAVHRLEQRVEDKRRSGHLVPLALRASLDDLRSELGRLQQQQRRQRAA